MTNLEYYKDELKQYIYDCSIGRIHGYKSIYKYDEVAEGIREFIKEHSEIWENDINSEEVVDWLLEEHKEPIKLKQWEKDLLETHEPRYIFNNLFSIYKMKKRGYFKGVTDANMTIGEILDNCEVVD